MRDSRGRSSSTINPGIEPMIKFRTEGMLNAKDDRRQQLMLSTIMLDVPHSFWIVQLHSTFELGRSPMLLYVGKQPS